MRRQQDSVSESRALLACHAGVQSFEIQFNLVVGCDVIGENGQFSNAIFAVRSVQLSLLRCELLRSETALTI